MKFTRNSIFLKSFSNLSPRIYELVTNLHRNTGKMRPSQLARKRCSPIILYSYIYNTLKAHETNKLSSGYWLPFVERRFRYIYIEGGAREEEDSNRRRRRWKNVARRYNGSIYSLYMCTHIYLYRHIPIHTRISAASRAVRIMLLSKC